MRILSNKINQSINQSYRFDSQTKWNDPHFLRDNICFGPLPKNRNRKEEVLSGECGFGWWEQQECFNGVIGHWPWICLPGNHFRLPNVRHLFGIYSCYDMLCLARRKSGRRRRKFQSHASINVIKIIKLKSLITFTTLISTQDTMFWG